MVFTYSGDPSDSDRDAVRFLSGDDVATDFVLEDAEINWLLTQEANVYYAAAAAAERIATKWAGLADKQVGDLKISYRDQAKQFRTRAADLRRRALMGGAKIHAPNQSQDEIDTREDNSDRVRPAFSRGMHDNPGAPADRGTPRQDFNDDNT